jgi:hypothetical protein
VLGVKAALFGDIKGRVEDGTEGFGKADGLHDHGSLKVSILPELRAPVSPAGCGPIRAWRRI